MRHLDPTTATSAPTSQCGVSDIDTAMHRGRLWLRQRLRLRNATAATPAAIKPWLGFFGGADRILQARAWRTAGWS